MFYSCFAILIQELEKILHISSRTCNHIIQHFPYSTFQLHKVPFLKMDRPDYQSISLSLDYESFSIDRVKIDIGHRDNPIVVIFGENAKEGISFDLRKKILLHPTDTNLLNRAECVDLAERIARVLENLSVKEEIAR